MNPLPDVNAILYFQTPAPSWKQSLHDKVIRNPKTFLQSHISAVTSCTVVSATGSYAVVCIDLADDSHKGRYNQEFIIEFDTKKAALDWLAEVGITDCVCQHEL